MALEEVNVYKKNNKALCDVLTLYGYFLEKNNSYLLEKNNNLVSYMLVDNVIKDLEDKEVDIPLKGKSIKKLVEKDQEMYDSLKNRGINLSRDYRFNEVCNYYGNDSSYDIVSCIFKSNESFVSDILCSDIPIDKRVDILYEFMLSIINSYDLGFYMFKSILSVKGPGTKNKINSIKKQEKIEELLIALKKMLKDNYDKKEKLVLTILNSIKPYKMEWLNYLQDNALVNFSDIKIVNNDVSYSVLPAIYKIANIDEFIGFYQKIDLSSIPINLKENDHQYFLNIDPKDLPKLIALKEFELSDEDGKILGQNIFNYQKQKEEVNQDVIIKIKEAIIHKSTNKNEYKKYCNLNSSFEENANYEEYQKKEKQNREDEKRKLQRARNELYLRLYSINNDLKEQVLKKTVIKDIKY